MILLDIVASDRDRSTDDVEPELELPHVLILVNPPPLEL